MSGPELVETWTNTVTNAAQVVALAVGGWWAYRRFIRGRLKWSRLSLEAALSDRKLNDEHLWLHVAIRVENAGQVLAPIRELRADVYQVLPVSDKAKRQIENATLISEQKHEADWDCLESKTLTWGKGESELEPGEGDHYTLDFLLSGIVETVYVYCYIPNELKPEPDIGWSTSVVYDLGDADR